MASFTRKMIRRNARAASSPRAAIALKNNKLGINLGVTNAKSPKPLSNSGRGSRRGKSNWRSGLLVSA